MNTTTDLMMPGTPKPWMNTAMRIMLDLPGLRLLLGRMFAVITVTARVPEGDEAREVLSACLTANPRVAKFYGIDPGEAAAINPADIDRLSERVVPIVITPDP